MGLTKKRNEKLWKIFLLSFVPLLLAILMIACDDDEYVVGWLISVSQALAVFAIFRFPKIREMQKKSERILIITRAVLAVGVAITFVGVILNILYPNNVWRYIARAGSFVAGLGINAFVCYISNEFDIIEEKEDRREKQEKKKNARKTKNPKRKKHNTQRR